MAGLAASGGGCRQVEGMDGREGGCDDDDAQVVLVCMCTVVGRGGGQALR